MTKRKLRVGLVGCGRFSLPGHAPYYAMHPRVEFVAVCDSKLESASRIAGMFRVPGVFENYERMFDEARPEAVSICTPTFTHEEITLAAAERGIHVLCEKPFSTTPDSARKMISACKENNVVLHVGFHKRYDRGIEFVRDLISRGEYGRCFHAEFRWHGLSAFGTVPFVNNTLKMLKQTGLDTSGFSPDWRLTDPRTPGGVLEVLCHLIDLALWMFGEPDSVEGGALRIGEEVVKPDHGAIFLRYAGDRIVYINMSNKALALRETESGLFNCEKGNIRYSSNPTRQVCLPAGVSIETGEGLFGRKFSATPFPSVDPLRNLPHYRKINNFVLDSLGDLPGEERENVAGGEAGLAADSIIHVLA